MLSVVHLEGRVMGMDRMLMSFGRGEDRWDWLRIGLGLRLGLGLGMGWI